MRVTSQQRKSSSGKQSSLDLTIFIFHYLTPYSVRLSIRILFLLSKNSSLSNFKKSFLHPKDTITTGSFHNYGRTRITLSKNVVCNEKIIADRQSTPTGFNFSVLSKSPACDSHQNVKFQNVNLVQLGLRTWTGLSTACWEKCTRVSAVSSVVQLYKINQTVSHEHAQYRCRTFKGLLLLSFCLTWKQKKSTKKKRKLIKFVALLTFCYTNPRDWGGRTKGITRYLVVEKNLVQALLDVHTVFVSLFRCCWNSRL